METAVKERPILFSGEMVRAILEGRKTQTRRVVKCLPALSRRTGTTLARPSSGQLVVRNGSEAWDNDETRSAPIGHCPYGQPGDCLWVRETWADVNSEDGPSILYRADGALQSWHDFSTSFGPDYGAGPSMDYDAYPGDYCMWWSDLWRGEPDHKWKPSIFMPRWASRITLEVTDVRVERVQDISEADAAAEGVGRFELAPGPSFGSYGNLEIKGHPLTSTHAHAFRVLWDSINGSKPGCSWADNPWVWAVSFRRVT